MIKPTNGMVLYSPGYDSGTELNDESCEHIPGPACSGQDNDGMDPDGEGMIHVHRGVHGVGNLTASVYDWRNPVMKVVFEQM